MPRFVRLLQPSPFAWLVASWLALSGVANSSAAEFGAELRAHFDYEAATRAVRIAYTVRNGGAQALAVLDRGDRKMVSLKRQQLGDNGLAVSERDGDALTLRLSAEPLPKSTPTVPPSPLAARLMPGATLKGLLRAELPADAKRLRLCIGLMPFAEPDFHDPQTGLGIEVWRAHLSAAKTQTMVCSQWFIAPDR